jgi:hypothetical protein
MTGPDDINTTTQDGRHNSGIEGMEALCVGNFVRLCADLWKITFTPNGQMATCKFIGCATVFGRVTDKKFTINGLPVVCVQAYRRTMRGYKPTDVYYTPSLISYTNILEIGDELTCIDVSDYLPGDIGRYYGYYDIVVYNSRTHNYSFKEFVYKTWSEGLKVRVVELTINGVRVCLLKALGPILYILKRNEVIYLILGIEGNFIPEDI